LKKCACERRAGVWSGVLLLVGSVASALGGPAATAVVRPPVNGIAQACSCWRGSACFVRGHSAPEFLGTWGGSSALQWRPLGVFGFFFFFCFHVRLFNSVSEYVEALHTYYLDHAPSERSHVTPAQSDRHVDWRCNVVILGTEACACNTLALCVSCVLNDPFTLYVPRAH